MVRLSLIATVALGALAATIAVAQDNPSAATSRQFAPLNDIEWSYASRARDEDGDAFLRLQRDGMNTTMGADNLPVLAEALAPVSAGKPGDPISFELAREAGVLACTGTVTVRGRAAGTCRFEADQRFVAELAARGLYPEDVEEMLGLTLVDARVASIEDISRAGFEIADVDELMTVAALEVTGAYAAELREAGLQAQDLDELVSAKAVGVDAGWIAEMAEAGYPNLELEKAIELRALGVTPDYARRMARVMRAVEGSE
jgi:hypothetical protein